MAENSRARVAITLPGKPDNCEPEDFTGQVIHVGHARTLLLGQIIAKARSIPFHVRIDGCYGVPHTGPAVVDLYSCMGFLGITPDRVYFLSNRNHGYTAVTASGEFGGEALERTWNTDLLHTSCRNGIVDDYADHPRTLVIRGREFAEPEECLPPIMASGTRSFIEQEALFRRLAGASHHEINVPLVTVAGAKMSKTAARSVHWSVLTMVAPEVARNFLTATAARPDDPLGWIEHSEQSGIWVADIGTAPYEWSWQTWREVVIRSAQVA